MSGIPEDQAAKADAALLDALDRYWENVRCVGPGKPALDVVQGEVPSAQLRLLEVMIRLKEACLAVQEDSRVGADEVVVERQTGVIDSLTEGAVLGEFRIEGRLGKGGMGEVYRAFHLRLKQPVALKVITPRLLASPEMAARFDREMEVVARLDHPNVVRVLHAGEADSRRYLVMELVEGEDLAARVRRQGPLPIAEAVELVRQAALGLQHASERGVVHRDVKPSNLMVTSGGTVKLLDLGLARLQADERGSPGREDGTQPGQGLGSPDYMAPEQIAHAGTVDIRADLYSLGATLFFLLAGRAPFEDVQGAFEKMKAHESQVAPDVRSLRPEIPVGLAELVARLMAKNPAERPASPAEVAQALDGWTQCETSIYTPGPAPRRGRRRGVRVAVGLGVGMIVVGGLALALVPRTPTGRATTDETDPEDRRPTVATFEVAHIALIVKGKEENPERGLLGFGSFSTRIGDHAKVAVRLSRPAYGYLLAYAADGKEHLLDPETDIEPPGRSDRLAYGHRPVKGKLVDYELNDGVGLHLFVAVISDSPLPAYADWQKQHGRAPWSVALGRVGAVWRQVGGDLYAVTADNPDVRGPGAAELGVTPVERVVAWWRKQPGIDEVGLTGFSVTKAD